MDHLAFIELMGEWGDALGVAVIVVGVIWGLIRFPLDLSRQDTDFAYTQIRNQITRTLLLGLEVLVAADIIRTVAVSPTLQSVAVLAAIVAIRTFLSWSLILEMEGRWPWQKSQSTLK
ncbi:MAG: DUF1622 domain-containing protein [Rhodocyclaceae bacterium]|nr:DUF1622 domain-containing protein [Rhodocyclaceae bacterium]